MKKADEAPQNLRNFLRNIHLRILNTVLSNLQELMGSRMIPSSYRMMSLNPLLTIMFMLYTLSLSSCSQSIASLVVVYFSERET